MTTITTTITFHSIFRSIYIRQLIFKHIGDIQNHLYRPDEKDKRRSISDDRGRPRQLLKGRDIIKLPRLEMISKFGMPWNFQCHYLPKDCNQILLNRRRLAITQYCCHRNATLDTLKHLLKWSTDFEFKWKYLNDTIDRNSNKKINQDVLEYLIKISPKKNVFLDTAMDVACKSGYLSVVKMLYSTKGIKFNRVHMTLACQAPSIDIVKYINDSGIGNCEDAMDEAAEINSLEIVKFFHFNTTQGASTWAMDWASMHGHIEMVRFLSEHRSEGSTTRSMDWAAENGHIDVVKYLQEHRSEGASTSAIDRASRNGYIEVVKYLYEHRSEGATTNAIDAAVLFGHFDVVKYLYENQIECDATTNIDIHIGDDAISKGGIEMVKYLVETVKAKCTPETVGAALRHDKLDIYQYLYDRFSADSSIWTKDIMNYAARYGYIDILMHLHEHKCKGATTRAMDWASQNGRIEVVKFLHEHRSEGATTDAMDMASQNGHIEMVKFLHDNRTEGCTKRALKYACRNGHVEVAKFLINTRNEKCNEKILGHRDIIWSNHCDDIFKLILPLFVGRDGIESIKSVITQMRRKQCYEAKQLLRDYLQQLKGDSVIIIMTTTTTTITFQSIFRAKYIRQLIFNHISDISKQLNTDVYFKRSDDRRPQRLLKGRDIIKLPRLEMISHFAMPWHFLCHYLPIDCNQILLNRRRRVISEYCHHPNATFDTLDHLMKWSTGLVFKWKYFKDVVLGKFFYKIHFNQDVLEYLIKICPLQNRFLYQAMKEAIKNGYLPTVKMLHSTKGIKLDSTHMEIACRSSSIEVVKYIHDSGVEECQDALDEAAKNSLEIVKFLHFNRSEGASIRAMENAAEKGHIEIVRFLQEHRSEGASAFAMDWAAEKGHIEIVRFLQEHRSEGASIRAMENAAENGHIEVVKYLYFNRTEGASTRTVDYAAKKGNVDVLKSLYQHQRRHLSTLMDCALKFGNFDFFKYLYENQTNHAKTMIDKDDGVVSKGGIEMVKYLVETVKAKCTKYTLSAALKYVMDSAARYGYIDIVKHLHFNRSEGATTDAMNYASRKGHIEIVKFLSEYRTEGATTWAMDFAAKKGHIEIVKFLHFNRSEGCTEGALENACRNGHVEVASFLINVRNEKCTEKILGYRDVLWNHYDDNGILKLILPHFVGRDGIESIERVITKMRRQQCYEAKQLLRDYLQQLKGRHDQDNNQQQSLPPPYPLNNNNNPTNQIDRSQKFQNKT
ncbi:hypothetical protein DFA_04333 [Cavenderia fasciculata]|uniref:Ankyrin repeat-containing protein n=1 Tax=Cavenderia fasciculata TaxID=261658 RepID=F4PPA2_CACFS|nr:uncharacterized protein DFA_04333 [Cavenderia fasciculata]EGG22215.1 hypothetical protein DFA_04333 [Cavenderia fasciculata]|eukprot:XP_004360066.1 hypothetical protein DFA_04333 [Cavenderia fasciculata]